MAPPHTNLKAVNGFLTSRSYLDGYKPTQVDTSYFNAIGAVSKNDGLTNLYRWWLHISSFTEAQRAAFPGEAKDLTAGKKAAEDEEDDEEEGGFWREQQRGEEWCEHLLWLARPWSPLASWPRYVGSVLALVCCFSRSLVLTNQHKPTPADPHRGRGRPLRRLRRRR